MAITDKEEGVWGLDQVYNKINQGGIWDYDGINAWYTMGYNRYGECGLNTGYFPPSYTQVSYSSPIQLPGTTWSKISGTSGRGFFGVKTDGTAWAWGYDQGWGVNGQNNVIKYSSPTQIGTDTTWGSNFARDDTDAMWIKTDGTLWSWGYNWNGVGGKNTTNPVRYSSPAQVGTDTTWSNVLVGSASAHAVKTDGTLWAWGLNNSGALGQNNTTYRSSPTQIGTGTDWSGIAVASDTKFGIKTDGSLWSWGGGSYGKQAQNTQGAGLSSPTQVGTDTTWDSLSTGYTHIISVKTDGTLWSWGYNPFGNLGQNDQGFSGSTSRSSPTQIGTATDWSQVASGYLTSAATKTDGTLWTWGENEGGQLGINIQGGAPQYLNCRSSPTQVGSGTGWSDPAATREEFFVKRIL